MKHLLVLISFLLLSSFLTSCEKKNGPGTETYEDGSSYVGVFKDGERNGQGTYTYGKGKWEGDKYVGEWKDEKYHGQGTYTFSNGSKYVGEYKDGEKWNGVDYTKYGSISRKWVKGVKQ